MIKNTRTELTKDDENGKTVEVFTIIGGMVFTDSETMEPMGDNTLRRLASLAGINDADVIRRKQN